MRALQWMTVMCSGDCIGRAANVSRAQVLVVVIDNRVRSLMPRARAAAEGVAALPPLTTFTMAQQAATLVALSGRLVNAAKMRQSESALIGVFNACRLLGRRLSGGDQQRLSLWGDGLVDQSLTALWQPCDWNEISDDELVFLIPSLVSTADDGAGTHSCGVSRFLRRALCARLRWASLVLSPGADRESPPDRLLAAVAQTKAITAIPVDEAWIEGEECFGALYAGAVNGPAKWFSSRAADREAASVTKDWTFELAILKCMDQLLRESLQTAAPGGAARASARESSDLPLSLADLVMVSTYSSVNAAYVYSQFATFHETFAVGAWLGHLLRGRAALMPASIAEWILDCLEREPTDADSDWNQCERFLRWHVELVGGRRHLVKVARKVVAQGHSPVVRPSHHARKHLGSSGCIWNRALWDQLEGKLKQLH